MTNLGRVIQRAQTYDNINAALGNGYKDQLSSDEIALLSQVKRNFETYKTDKNAMTLAVLIVERLMSNN